MSSFQNFLPIIMAETEPALKSCPLFAKFTDLLQNAGDKNLSPA
jgi:hypothetical protein